MGCYDIGKFKKKSPHNVLIQPNCLLLFNVFVAACRQNIHHLTLFLFLSYYHKNKELVLIINVFLIIFIFQMLR